MKRTIVLVMVVSLLGKITGFIREAVMASSVGANAYTDAYIYSLTISALLTSLVMSGYNTALLPVLSEAEKNGERDIFFSRMISLNIPLLLLVTGLICVFSPQLLYVFAPGITDEIRALTETFARILSISIFFQGMQALLIGFLQKNNRFFFTASMAFPLNLAIITGAYLSNPTNVYPLVISTALGQGFTFLWLLYGMRGTGFHFKLDFNYRDQYIKTLFIMITPILISMGAEQVNLAVDRALASFLPSASASYLSYASKIQGLFTSVFIASISTVLYKKQSEIASEKNYLALFEMTKDNISNILMFAIPCVVGVIILSQEVIELALMRNNFTISDAKVTSTILIIYSFLIMFYTFNDMIARLYFAIKKTSKPVTTTVISVGINIILNLIFMQIFGVYGLALATVVASGAKALMLIFMVKRESVFGKQSIIKKSIFEFLSAAAIMGAILHWVKNYTAIGNLSTVLYMMSIAFLGVGLYSFLLYVFKNEEFIEVIKLIQSRLKY